MNIKKSKEESPKRRSNKTKDIKMTIIYSKGDKVRTLKEKNKAAVQKLVEALIAWGYAVEVRP